MGSDGSQDVHTPWTRGTRPRNRAARYTARQGCCARERPRSAPPPGCAAPTRVRNARMRLTALVSAAVVVLLAGPATAQVSLNPRALGMGGAYIGVARGHESLFENPANLGLPHTSHWSAGIPTLAIAGEAIGLSLGDLNALRDYGGLSQEQIGRAAWRERGSG